MFDWVPQSEARGSQQLSFGKRMFNPGVAVYSHYAVRGDTLWWYGRRLKFVNVAAKR